MRLHATCVAIDGRGVLIEGASGAGKSDLALRLIDRGAVLVSDDQTLIGREGDCLYASAPPTITGQLEARGVGILTLPVVDRAPVMLIVTLGAPERLPEPTERTLDGVRIPTLVVAGLEPSAPLKVEHALRGIGQ